MPHDSFDRDMSFEQFIETQFSDGVTVNNLKSIYNRDETISIYPSHTKLEIGGGYAIYTNNSLNDRLESKILSEIKEHESEFTDDFLYVETTIGTYSLSDLYPYTHEVKQKESMIFLELKQEKMRDNV